MLILDLLLILIEEVIWKSSFDVTILLELISKGINNSSLREEIFDK